MGREQREGESGSPRRKRQDGKRAKEDAAGPWLPGKGLERRLRGLRDGVALGDIIPGLTVGSILRPPQCFRAELGRQSRRAQVLWEGPDQAGWRLWETAMESQEGWKKREGHSQGTRSPRGGGPGEGLDREKGCGPA